MRDIVNVRMRVNKDIAGMKVVSILVMDSRYVCMYCTVFGYIRLKKTQVSREIDKAFESLYATGTNLVSWPHQILTGEYIVRALARL